MTSGDSVNRNFLFGFAAAAAVLGVLAFIGWSLFEIYPQTKFLPPSREARTNRYLALDRWLKGMGIPVRTARSGDLSSLSQAEEKNIFIQASLFRWTDESAEYLASWVEGGGNLVLVLDYYDLTSDSSGDSIYGRSETENCLLLLDKFGVGIAGDDQDDEDRTWSALSPDYGANVSFRAARDEHALYLKDWTDRAKLAEVKRGKGKFTVTGNPVFLYSQNLKDAPNARLAWAIFAADISGSGAAASRGWFFIRGTARVRGLLGDLFTHGNLAVLLVSMLVLLVVCFWAVIPVFGLVRLEDERTGKSLRERFLAEGRFLKRCDALEYYCTVYLKEIKRLLAKKEGLGDDEAPGRILEIWDLPSAGKDAALARQDRYLLAGFLEGRPFPKMSFPRLISILLSILERI